MTSFATDDVIRTHVTEHGLGDPLVFHQFVSLRLETDGKLFHDDAGKPSLYAPGTATSSRHSAARACSLHCASVAFASSRSRTSTTSAHGVDAVVIGMHLISGKPVTCEVARKEGDMGGAPVRVDGQLQLLEGPRFPTEFDQELVPVFNTNTALFDLDALDCDYDLTWLYVQKEVGGRTAVQVERLYHEVSAFLPTTYLEVPAGVRAGASCRSRRLTTWSEHRTICVSCSRRRRSDTKSSRRCYRSRRTVVVCVRSMSSSRSVVRSADPRDARCVRPADGRLRVLLCRSANDAALRERGPCVGAPSARGGGSRFHVRGRRSSTTNARGFSSGSGRSGAGVDLRRTPRLSSQR